MHVSGRPAVTKRCAGKVFWFSNPLQVLSRRHVVSRLTALFSNSKANLNDFDKNVSLTFCSSVVRLHADVCELVLMLDHIVVCLCKVLCALGPSQIMWQIAMMWKLIASHNTNGEGDDNQTKKDIRFKEHML